MAMALRMVSTSGSGGLRLAVGRLGSDVGGELEEDLLEALARMLLLEGFERVARPEPTPCDHEDAVAGGDHLLHDVGGEDHRVLALEAADELPHLEDL